MDTSVGQRIKLVRGQRTQAEFAESLGVHKNSLSRYERGSSCPDADFISRLCTKYGISIAWLVLGDGVMHPEDGGEPATSHRAGQKSELDKERDLTRDLMKQNRDLIAENRQLWKENGELKVKIGELNVQNVKLEGELDTARKMAKEYHEELQARAAPDDVTPPEVDRDVA